MTVNDLMHFGFSLEGYKVSDEATKAGDSNVRYYGYVNRLGEYYIMERNITNKTYRYARGSTNYSTAWNARESASYDYFHETFK